MKAGHTISPLQCVKVRSCRASPLLMEISSELAVILDRSMLANDKALSFVALLIHWLCIDDMLFALLLGLRSSLFLKRDIALLLYNIQRCFLALS